MTEFFVPGIPVPQGSKQVVTIGGKARLIDANPKPLKAWRKTVANLAGVAHLGPQLEGPVALHLNFRFVRPKTSKRAYPDVKPDVDKLTRAVMDALTDSGVIRDDAQVVDLIATERYRSNPGVAVRVESKQEDTE